MVLNFSSHAGLEPMPFIPVYSATKVYDDFLSQSVGASVSESITMVSVTPLGVTTNMTKQLDSKGSALLVTAEAFAKAVFDNLHHERTMAHWWHNLQNLSFQVIPERWRVAISRKMMRSLIFN